MQSEALRLYGTAEPVPPVRTLRAGALTLELQAGRLRRIRCGAHEVWHGLAFVLRDADWGTPEPEWREESVREHADGFEVELDGRWAIGIVYSLRLRGDAHGVHVEAEATAEADVAINRLGLCLLHPLSACGARVELRHVDGRTSTSTFPETIPPWPPFMLVRALRHEWAPGRWAEAELHGDLFETEDQRNNGDASFKTYSRSNLAPRPYTLEAGTVVRQSAVLRVDADVGMGPTAPPTPAASASAGPPGVVTVRLGAAAGPLPAVGVEIHAADAIVPALPDALRELQPAHLHLAWRPGEAVAWAGVAAMLTAAGARLRLDVHGGDAGALQALARALAAAGIAPESLAVFPSTASAVAAARAAFPGTPVGGGTPHFFVQLSRLDHLGPVDYASCTTSALVHGADDDDVMAGLASLPAMVRSWRARHPDIPLRMGPNGIAMRASPLGEQPASDGTRRLALAAFDPRSRAQFGAAWMLGHVAALAALAAVATPGVTADPAGAGVEAITLADLAGPSGVVHAGGGRMTRSPAFDVLRQLGRPALRRSCTVSHPERIAALAIERDGHPLLLLANLTAERQAVHVEGPSPAALRLGAYAVQVHR